MRRIPVVVPVNKAGALVGCSAASNEKKPSWQRRPVRPYNLCGTQSQDQTCRVNRLIIFVMVKIEINPLE